MSEDDAYRERYRDVLDAVEEHTSGTHPMVKKRNLAIVVAETTDWEYSNIKETIDAAIDRDDLFRHYERVAPMSMEAIKRIQMAEAQVAPDHDMDLVAHCNRTLGRLEEQ